MLVACPHCQFQANENPGPTTCFSCGGRFTVPGIPAVTATSARHKPAKKPKAAWPKLLPLVFVPMVLAGIVAYMLAGQPLDRQASAHGNARAASTAPISPPTGLKGVKQTALDSLAIRLANRVKKYEIIKIVGPERLEPSMTWVTQVEKFRSLYSVGVHIYWRQQSYDLAWTEQDELFCFDNDYRLLEGAVAHLGSEPE